MKDLSPGQKRAAEILLGHAVSEGEAVSIKSLGLTTIIPSKLSPEGVDCDLEKRLGNAYRPEVGE
ncbi:MAG TPA: hypothetical protein VN924_09275 [Bryobacteraceae bacterium]|nr:hypothetical protein [Bryobacteraceae bacterium]